MAGSTRIRIVPAWYCIPWDRMYRGTSLGYRDQVFRYIVLPVLCSLIDSVPVYHSRPFIIGRIRLRAYHERGTVYIYQCLTSYYTNAILVFMQYLDRSEIRRVLEVAYRHNRRNHLMMLVSLCHGLRVSELVNLRGSDISNGQLIVKRLKGSNLTTQPVRVDSDPLFDCSALIALAAERCSLRLFELTPRHLNRIMAAYCEEAGIHPSKAHWHVWKHSTAMTLWEVTGSLGKIQSYLGHKSASSTLCYLYEVDGRKASEALAAVRF